MEAQNLDKNLDRNLDKKVEKTGERNNRGKTNMGYVKEESEDQIGARTGKWRLPSQ
jgi:hypothetical protein